MGITGFTITLLNEALQHKRPESVCELGAQNLYDAPYPNPMYADVWYRERKMEYRCIDLNKENNAIPIDLEKERCHLRTVDMVTDFGTSEHIRNYYNVWKYKHDLCNEGGTIISENPKTGNWPNHGFNYLTKEFYTQLAKKMKYEIIKLGEHPAMGNVTDGWNVYCILKKTKDNDFMNEKDFDKLSFKSK